MSAAIAKLRPQSALPVLTPTTFDQLCTFADMAASSGMVPKAYDGKPGAIMIAVQMGAELGLSPMQSLTSIAVINGRPGVWGDGLIGICRGSPLCEDIIETIEGEGDQRTATTIAKRRGATPVTRSFSVADAKRAGLWQTEEKVKRKSREGGWYETTNDSTWYRYPDRMLTNRARGFALRDAFPDLLRGLKTVEELRDYPQPDDSFRGPTIDADAEVSRNNKPAADAAADIIAQRNATSASADADKKRTIGAWLADLRGMLAACHTPAEIEAVTDTDEVRAAVKGFRNGALEELNSIMAEAIARVHEAAGGNEEDEDEDDTFPGDRP